MPRDKLAPSAPRGVPTQADRERPAPKPKPRGRGRTVETEAPARPLPTDRPGRPAFQASRGHTVDLPVLHGPSSASPAAQRVLRNEFGVYEHPLPHRADERARVLRAAARYKLLTGRNLLQQRNPGDALREAEVGGHARFSGGTADPRPRFVGELDPITHPHPTPTPPRTTFSGEGVADVHKDWTPGDVLPRFRMPGVFAGRGGGNQFGGRQTLHADEVATPTPSHFMEASENIERLGGLKPKLTVPHALFDKFGVMDAYASGRGLTPEDKKTLKDKFGDFGLFDDVQRRELIRQAQENGWSEADVASLTDQELIDKAHTPTHVGPGKRIATNFFKNVAQLGAIPAGGMAAGEAIGDAVEQRSPQPLQDFVQEGFVDPTVKALTHPWKAFQDDPLFTATTLSGAGRAAGFVAGRTVARGLLPGGARAVPLHPNFNNPQTGAPMIVPRGLKSRNAFTRPLQIAQDKMTTRSENASSLLNANTAIRGSSEAQHLGDLSGAERAAPLIRAVKGLSEKERMTAEWFALQARDPQNTIRVFQQKLAKDLEREGAESPNAKYWQRQILLAEAADDALKGLHPEKVAQVRQAAAEIEAANQDDLAALGMSRDSLDDRLWDLAIRENPDFDTHLASRRAQRKEDAHAYALRRRDAQKWATRAGREASSLEAQAAKIKGRTQKGRTKKDSLLARAQQKRRDAEALQAEANTRPQWESTLDGTRTAIRDDMTAAGETPTMYGPHTPGQLGTGGRVRAGRPVVTSALDNLGGRVEARNLSTYERGRVLPSPDMFERAAGMPARARVTAEETQRRVADAAGHKIDLPDEAAARNFDFDDDQWVVVQTGGNRHGSTRLDAGVNERRQTELNDLMESVDAGNAESATDLFRKTFRVAERNPHGRLEPGEYYAIPKATFEALERRAVDMAKQGGGLAKITRGWRGLTLNTLPRTVVNNIVGSVPLAAAGGAGPASYVRAVAAMKRGHLPGEIRNVGLSGGTTRKIGWQKPGAKQAAGWMNTMRKGNVFGEDAARGAIYMKGAHKAANKAAGRKWFAGLRPLNDEAQQVMEAWAKNPAERPPTVEAFIQKSFDFAGNLAAGKRLGQTAELLTKGGVRSFRDEQVALAVPFHQWYRHMVRLTLLTMPAKYPGRAIFLQNLAAVGDDYRKQHGVWPPWMRDMVPTGQHADTVMGYDDQGEMEAVPQAVTEGFRTSSLNPFATAGQVIGEGDNVFNSTLGGLSPVVQLPLELATGKKIGGLSNFDPFRNENGDEVSVGTKDWLRVGANSFIASIPLAKWATGLFDDMDIVEADTSLPWDQQEKYYSAPGGGPLPSAYKPRSSAPGGVLPTLLRGVGVPLAQVDAAGPRTAISTEKRFRQARADYRRHAKKDDDS